MLLISDNINVMFSTAPYECGLLLLIQLVHFISLEYVAV